MYTQNKTFAFIFLYIVIYLIMYLLAASLVLKPVKYIYWLCLLFCLKTMLSETALEMNNNTAY